MNKHKWLVHLCMGFVKLTGILPVWLLFKPRVHLAPGAKRWLPKPSILVSNHRSLLDFVLYLLVFPFRTIRFLMAEVLYRIKPLAILLNAIGGIRVERQAKEFGFVANTLSVLEDGGTVGIFPQGRLPLNGKPFPFTVSTAFIALKTQAPIVPVYTDGNYGLFKRANVVIGQSIRLQEYCKEGLTEQEQLAQLTQLLEEKVMALEEVLKHEKRAK